MRFAIQAMLLFGVMNAAAFAIPVDDAKPASAWPVFRGNAQQNGVAHDTMPETLAVRWKFTTKDAVEATAAIEADRVYIGSMDEHLYALELATGKEVWRYKAAPFKVAAAVADGVVFAGDMDGVFHAVDAATGKPRWKFDTQAEITSAANLTSDSVLFGCGNETLYCLNRDGKERWTFKVAGGPVLGTPAIVGGRTFVSGCDSRLHVIDLATGKELASVELDGQTGATPAVAGEMLFVGTMAKQVLGIDWKKAEVLWRYEPSRRANDFYSSAAATEKIVVVGSRDKRLHALDAATGKEAWTFLTKGHVDSSPVIVGKRVIVGSNDGNLYVLDVENGSVRQTLPLGKEITASPAVAGQWLIVGTVDGVVCGLSSK